MTAEWSEHGFAEPKKSSEEETHTPKTLTPNYDESIFTTVTKCHKKAHTHATLPPALPLTQRAKPSRPRLPPAPSTAHSAHSNPHIQMSNDKSHTKGFCPKHGHMTQHESHSRVTTYTATCATSQAQARTTDKRKASNTGAYRTRS